MTKAFISSVNIFAANTTLHLFNIIGEEMDLFYKISSHNIKLFRSKLPEGIYIFEIRQDKQIIAGGKLLICN